MVGDLARMTSSFDFPGWKFSGSLTSGATSGAEERDWASSVRRSTQLAVASAVKEEGGAFGAAPPFQICEEVFAQRVHTVFNSKPYL